MAQFDFYQPVQGGAIWLDCQTELMDEFATRFVVPLIPVESALKPARHLNPVFEISGANYVMATHLAGAVLVSELPKRAGSLAEHRYEILNALDFLLTGV
jgi:toxin CcdB